MCCEVKSGAVAVCKPLAAGGHCPELFEAVEAAFDDVAVLVGLDVERGRASAARATS